MGTNYYAKSSLPCALCGHEAVERLHIGKSSAGWCFSLHVYPDEGPRTLAEWKERWLWGIVDEYGDAVHPEEMERIITRREWIKPPTEKGWYAQNHAEPGPNNLARHKIDGRCIAHGDGTYDLITGEFS